MTQFKSILVGLSLTASFAFAGCGDSDMVKSFDKAKDKVCACDTSECAMEAMKEIKMPESEPSKGDLEKVEKIGEEIEKCMTKLRDK